MDRSARDESKNELLALAQEQGYSVSATQLIRWHRAGLLPRPRQQPLKVTRGSCSLYPGGTGAQLLALCSMRVTERRFSHLAWQLWLQGYPVALRYVRIQLQHAALRLSRWMQWFVDLKQSIGEASEQALDFIERYAEEPLRSQPLRRLRKRVGREHFPSFIRILMDIAIESDSGAERLCDTYERGLDLRILALGFGLEKRFVQKKDALEYYLVQALIPNLRWVFSRLQEVSWEHLLDDRTDFDLLQARDELCTWLMRWQNARQYRNRLPADYPRWRIDVQQNFSSLAVADQALVVVGWLALRSQSSLADDANGTLW
jgi:hypothetical protein